MKRAAKDCSLAARLSRSSLCWRVRVSVVVAQEGGHVRRTVAAIVPVALVAARTPVATIAARATIATQTGPGVSQIASSAPA